MSYHRVLPRPVALSNEDLANRWALGPDSLRTARTMTNERSNTAYLKNGQIPASSSPESTSKKASASVVEQHKPSSAKEEELKPDVERYDSTSVQGRKPAPSNIHTWQGDIPSQICLCQPDPKVPRPRNAFILYRQHHQASIVAQNPGLPNPEISKVIGDHWRASPPEVKEHWKLLAEEEKIRHQKQYPDYRYQPRRTGRAGSLADLSHPGNSSIAETNRCVKCGGKSISSSNVMNTSASISAQGSPSISQPSSRYNSHSMPPPPATSNSTTGRFARGPGSPPVRDGLMQNYRFTRPQTAHALPLTSPRHTKRPPDDVMSPSSPDPKRRRIPTVSFAQSRGAQGPQTPFALAQPQQRRPSLPRPEFMGGVLPSPSAIGLPPKSVNGQTHPHTDSLRLPPLHTFSSAHTHATSGNNDTQQAKTLEAMIHSIPVLSKIRVLGRISGPLPLTSSLTSPVDFEGRKGRGPVIAVDSIDKVVLKQLTEALERTLKFEYDLKVFSTPEASEDQPTTMQAYLRLIDKYHDLSQEVMAHVCLPITETELTELDTPSVARKLSTVGRQLSTVELATTDEHDMEPMDVSSESPVSPKSFPKQRATSTKTNADTDAARDATTPEQVKRLLPIALLPAWQLTHTDFFATNVPITDASSPEYHWQWHATLWRGIVGADATVAVQTAHAEEPHGSPPNTANSGISGIGGATASVNDVGRGGARSSSGGKGDKNSGAGVDIRLEDSRAVILQAGERGTIGEGALRRVGFEIGEWVRGWNDREGL